MLRKFRYILARVLEIRARAAQEKGEAPEQAALLEGRAEEIYRRIDQADGRAPRSELETPHA